MRGYFSGREKTIRTMKLALQLSCYNGGRYLPYLFASLKKQTLRDWTLLVLDNASDEENKKIIEEAVRSADLSIQLFRVEENIGFAGAHNFLFARQPQDVEVVQLLNDDAVLESDFLEKCSAHLEANPGCAAVSGTIFRWNFEEREAGDQGKTQIVDSLGLAGDWRGFVKDVGMGKTLPLNDVDQKTREVFGVSGCLPMYRVSAVRDVSFDGALFDVKFRIYKEDVDLAFRLQAAKYTAARITSAYAYHRRSFGLRTFSRQSLFRTIHEGSYYSYRNHLWILKAHLRCSELFTKRIGVVPFEAAKAVYWLLRSPRMLFRAWRETWDARYFLRSKRDFVRSLRTRALPVIRKGRTTAEIGVITVSHNDLNDVCLSSLDRSIQACRPSVAVAIADNQSTKYRANELVQEHLPQAWCLLRDGDYGFGRSNNRAAQQMDVKYYFLLNPDTEITDANILNGLYDYMEAHPNVGIVAPKVLYFDGRLQETCRRFPKWYSPIVQRTSLGKTAFGKRYADEFAMRDFDHETERSIDWAQGSALFIRADVWNRLGGFDHRYFMYFEDVDLCRRTHLLGYDVRYLPSLTIKHAHGKESAKISNHLKNLLFNDMARAHLVSWIKYLWKWKGQTLPTAHNHASHYESET